MKEKPPFSPGYDMVGRVDAVGPDVEGWAVGDRVCDLTVIGANARFLVCDAGRLVRVPEEVEAAQATTLVLSWMTATRS